MLALGEAGGGGGDFDQPREIQPHNPPQSGGIDWENLCNQYGHLVGIKDPCYEYANGTQLTEKGKTALVCLLGGGITLLAGLRSRDEDRDYSPWTTILPITI